jgi:transposase-like protein
MGKTKLTNTQEQELAKTIFEAMPEVEEMSVLGLLQYGSSALLKEAVAEEITRYLGRGFYQHWQAGQEFKGERNGYRRTAVDTPIGQVIYDRPLVAYAPDFESKFHTPYMRRPKAFANAIADMHVNGVSHRSVKRALKSVTGETVRLSKSTISRITKRLIEEFRAWQKRDLSHLPVKYLILDATRLKMRMDSSAKQPVMIAYAVLEDGRMETISIAVKNSESNGAWGGEHAQIL